MEAEVGMVGLLRFVSLKRTMSHRRHEPDLGASTCRAVDGPATFNSSHPTLRAIVWATTDVWCDPQRRRRVHERSCCRSPTAMLVSMSKRIEVGAVLPLVRPSLWAVVDGDSAVSGIRQRGRIPTPASERPTGTYPGLTLRAPALNREGPAPLGGRRGPCPCPG